MAATVIDSLVVALILDPKQFKAGQAEVARDSAKLKEDIVSDANDMETAVSGSVDAVIKSIQEQLKAAKTANDAQEKLAKEKAARAKLEQDTNKKTQDSYAAITKEVLGGVAALVGANSLKDYITGTVKEMSNLKIAADNAGLSVSELFTFGNVIAANGGDKGAAKSSLTGLAATMQGVRSGLIAPSRDLIYGFSSIGAQMSDDPTAVFEKFAAWSEGKSKARVAQVGRSLGFDEGSINEAMKGRAAVAADFATARKNTPSDADVSALKDLQKTFIQTMQDAQGLGRELLVEVSPGLVKMTQELKDLIGWLTPIILFLEQHSVFATPKQQIGDHPALQAKVARDVANKDWLSLSGDAAVSDWYAISKFATDAYSGMFGQKTSIAPSGGTPAGNGRIAQAKAFFMSQGRSETEANGMVAAMLAENDTLDPNRTNPLSAGRSHAYGLGQWLGARQNDFKAWSGKDIHGSSFEDQLRFMWYELSQKYAGAGTGSSASAASTSMLTGYYMPGRGLAGDMGRASHQLAHVTTIGTLNIHTKATDGFGVARDFRKAMANPVVAQANSGMN